MGFSSGSGEVCFNQATLDHKEHRGRSINGRKGARKKQGKDLCPDLKNIRGEICWQAWPELNPDSLPNRDDSREKLGTAAGASSDTICQKQLQKKEEESRQHLFLGLPSTSFLGAAYRKYYGHKTSKSSAQSCLSKQKDVQNYYPFSTLIVLKPALESGSGVGFLH
ncbi:PREDICTED: uncharacterized protein LOC106548447 isoform X2 [Thamnophis sirtalis]|uniref:Uncharacterized protein LOC106548447 isoform X2 n=1 Tax=Thamnophis sirtalis TaxID=35019 RepID=A0A6I9YB12_9SAUR|nr:PREDICTED: uncharacterized protein LOC106548447 isoform X2 [Thamnophis sirtalis]